MIYKLTNIKGAGGISQALNRIDDDGKNWAIPLNPDNTDYQAYLKWLAEGNVPTPADGE